MSELICVNGDFPLDAKVFYLKHGVKTPKEGELYTVREIINHATKPGDGHKIGILLQEIRNPKVPVDNPILGSVASEPSWSSKRFSHLNGYVINERELIKEYATNKLSY